GCAGDIGPWNYWFGNDDALPQTYEHRDRLGRALAEHVLRVLPSAATSGDQHVAFHTQRLALRRRRLPWTDAEALALETRLAALAEAAYPGDWPGRLRTTNSAQPFPFRDP